MAAEAQKAVVRFGVFQVNLRSGELRRRGLKIRVSGQPFKILAILLEQSGEVVTREELQKNLWPDDTFVDFEHSLNSAIKKLRTVLGDSAENPRYIETIPRLGYRFIAPVERKDLPAIADRPTTPEPAALPATEEFRAAQQIDRVSAIDGSPILFAPFVAPVGEETAPGRASVDQDTGHAQKLAVRPGLWIRRALGFGVLLTVIAVVVFVIVTFRRNRESPFETITTTRLTSTGQSLKAAISPDGRYIVHTLITSGRESLCVRRATTLHDIEIVPPEPVHYLGITFSPDSENVYYVTHTAESDPPVLYRVPVMGGSSQKLKQDLASSITFSPDGRKFAFVRESATESTVMIADLDSGREQRVASRKLPEVLDYPAWSPDGRIVACTAVDTSISTPRGSDARIIEVRVGDGTERTLSSQTWGFIKQLAWLGDGHGLVMSARGQESGIFHVWYVSYPGGTARKLTDGLNHQVGASISADSRHIVTVEESALSGMWRLSSPQARDPKPIVSGLNITSSLVWMPDGRILFDKELNGSQNFWTVDADGTNQKQLMLAGNNYVPSISNDGRMLASLSDRNGSPAIWTMDIDGGNPVMVVKAFGDTVPQLSPDGKWIAFTAAGSGQWKTLWKVGSKGGRAIQLNDKLWIRPAISPDGKWIAGFYADQQLSTNKEPTSIAVIGIDGGQPWKVVPIPSSVSISAGVRWNPDGLQFTYVDSRNDGDNIWSRPLDGGAPHQVTHFHGDALFSFGWSRDGKQLVFSRGIEARDLVLIQDARQK